MTINGHSKLDTSVFSIPSDLPNVTFFSFSLCRPVPIVLVEYWKVAHYKKKLLKKLPKSGSSPIQFLDVFIKTLFKSFFFDPDSNG